MTRCCLVVTTHERPDALARVLAALAAQSQPPADLVAAGSTLTGEHLAAYVGG